MGRLRIAVVLSALLLGAVDGTALAAAKVTDPVVTVTFTGNYSSSTTNYLGAGDSSSSNVSWNASATGPVSKIHFNELSTASVTITFTAAGSLTATIPPPNEKMSCGGSLSAVPGSIIATSKSALGSEISVAGLAPITYGQIQSNQSSGFCAMGPKLGAPYTIGGSAAASDPKYRAWLTPLFSINLAGGSDSQSLSFSDAGKAGSGTETVHGTETLSIEPSAPPTKKKSRKRRGGKPGRGKPGRGKPGRGKGRHGTGGHKRGHGHPKPKLACKVPHLTGKTLAIARSLLTRAHCRLGRVTVSGAARSGAPPPGATVVAQRPRPATRLPVGGRVAVTVKRPAAHHRRRR